MTEAQRDGAGPVAAGEWRQLSAWSIFHFAAGAVIQNVQAAIFFAPATYGVARSDFSQYTWAIPGLIAAVVLTHAVLTYLFYRYRILGDRIEIRSGALLRKHLELPFERVQNVRLEHPFYFRPLGLVTLKVDGAGASGEEVNLAALPRSNAEDLRAYIARRKHQIEGAGAGDADTIAEDAPEERETVCFARTLLDLVVHGLTNNRSFLAIAGIAALASQSNLSPGDLVQRLGIDFDVVIAGFSVVRLALLFVLSFLLVVGIIAFLSVLVSIVTYYGFTVYRTGESLTIHRGLFTKHEIEVRKSRIQMLIVKQDWIDYLIDRRNIVLEQISHREQASNPADLRKRIVIPSVRLGETAALVNEVLPEAGNIDELPFTPVRKRYFYKHALIASVLYTAALAAAPVVPLPASIYVPGLAVLWSLHLLHVYMSWRRRGLAIDGDIVVVRSGTIGIEYHVFPAFRLQEVAHVQSLLMRRRDLSTVRFRTASSAVRVPYLSTDFARRVIDFCAYRVEASGRSWM